MQKTQQLIDKLAFVIDYRQQRNNRVRDLRIIACVSFLYESLNLFLQQETF